MSTPTLPKEVGLTFVAAAISVILFFFAALTIPDVINQPLMVSTLVVVGLLWVIAMALTLAVVPHIIAVGALITVATLSVIIAGRLNIGAVGGALLLMLSLLIARRTFIRDVENRIIYRTPDFFAGGTKLLVFGILLALAGLALPVLENSIKQDGVRLQEKQVATALQPLEPLLGEVSPGFESDANIDDVIDAQLRQQGVDPDTLSETQRQQLRQQISGSDTTPSSGQETLTSVVTTKINDTLRNITQANALTVALVVIVLAVLTLRALVPLITWLILGLIAGIVWLARKSGLVYLREDTAVVQRLSLDKNSSKQPLQG